MCPAGWSARAFELRAAELERRIGRNLTQWFGLEASQRHARRERLCQLRAAPAAEIKFNAKQRDATRRDAPVRSN